MKQIVLFCMMTLSMSLHAQKYMTKTGTVDFTSKAPLETIEGKNKAVGCLLDSKTGTIDFIVQIKSFVFDKKLMQEHFNENYMESDKFPKASFKGQITNLSAIQFSKDGEYKADVKGKLTIHGVTKDVSYSGKIIVRSGKLILASSFSVLLADYNIAIPGAVKDKVAKEVKINVQVSLDQMN
ncbi:MAG: YceI family protein [Chitinophagaceae bacterium]|nr:YceI family protein [Bacteroidota bacterium]MBP9932914.1 YceI family protein [Chitinophagaceae bacterium]